MVSQAPVGDFATQQQEDGGVQGKQFKLFSHVVNRDFFILKVNETKRTIKLCL